MKSIVITLLVCCIVGLGIPSRVHAQTEPQLTQVDLATATPSATTIDASTSAAIEASLSALLEQRIQERRDKDITESNSNQKSKLALYLDEHPIGALSWHNFLQTGIREAINNGLPANIVVLIILFPIITAIISASRHLIGLQGFGIYIPAVLSVAFVSTGIGTGIIMFMAVLLATFIFRTLIKYLKLQYLPRTALLLWGVSIFILALLILATMTGFSSVLTISIFPLLIIMLLTENFMETQLSSTRSQAVQLTLETLLIAILCSVLIGWEPLQKIVLLNPELTILSVAIFNILVGKYSGLRLLEYIRFKSILDN